MLLWPFRLFGILARVVLRLVRVRIEDEASFIDNKVSDEPEPPASLVGFMEENVWAHYFWHREQPFSMGVGSRLMSVTDMCGIERGFIE